MPCRRIASRPNSNPEDRGREGAGEYGQLRRQAPRLRGMAGDVSRRSQECRMTERQQAGIADEQIEGAGEDGETQHVHEKNRIDEERRDEEHRNHAGEGPIVKACRAVACPTGDRCRWRWMRHAVLPNSPAGLIISTMAMMTKITVLDASG